MEQAEVLELTVEYVKLIKQQKFTLNYKGIRRQPKSYGNQTFILTF